MTAGEEMATLVAGDAATVAELLRDLEQARRPPAAGALIAADQVLA